MSQSDEQILDLYSGMGGFGTGFSTYFKVPDAVDQWKDACKTYEKNHEKTIVHNNDVWDFVQDCIKKDFEGILFDGVIGGPPCQEFSILNHNQNHTNKRANQVIIFSKIVKTLQPKFAMLENVFSIPAKLKQQTIKNLKDAGYKVSSRVIYASHFGSVQTRRRWILTACKSRHVFPSPTKVNRQAKDILIPGAISELKLTEKIQKQLQTLPRGKWVALPGKKWKEYFIVDPHKCLPAIVNVTKNMIIAPDRDRKLSFAEILQAQGFSKNYQMYGGITSKAQQLANAIPVELAQRFAYEFFKTLHPEKTPPNPLLTDYLT